VDCLTRAELSVAVYVQSAENKTMTFGWWCGSVVALKISTSFHIKILCSIECGCGYMMKHVESGTWYSWERTWHCLVLWDRLARCVARGECYDKCWRLEHQPTFMAMNWERPGATSTNPSPHNHHSTI
jgi:hypothetical protein